MTPHACLDVLCCRVPSPGSTPTAAALASAGTIGTTLGGSSGTGGAASPAATSPTARLSRSSEMWSISFGELKLLHVVGEGSFGRVSSIPVALISSPGQSAHSAYVLFPSTVEPPACLFAPSPSHGRCMLQSGTPPAWLPRCCTATRRPLLPLAPWILAGLPPAAAWPLGCWPSWKRKLASC